MTKLSDLDYVLPRELISQAPQAKRDQSRLFVYSRIKNKVSHYRFHDVIKEFSAGDVLVLNNTKVIPARLVARLIGDDGSLGRVFKVLLVKKTGLNSWESLIDGKKRKLGQSLWFSKTISGELVGWHEGCWRIKFNQQGKKLDEILFKLGELPLPPYIKNPKAQIPKSKPSLTKVPEGRQGRKGLYKDFYQTVYAEKLGSVAAPTAGFHFTKSLLSTLKKKGVKILFTTLHVGPGTFLPVRSENLAQHKMHEEQYSIDKKTWEEIKIAKKKGARVYACGTTVARVLESVARSHKLKGETRIFIYPPYKFEIVDRLITNFHLPKTTLLALVAAFLDPKGRNGLSQVKKLYKEAISKKYRFYSFGDAMLIE